VFVSFILNKLNWYHLLGILLKFKRYRIVTIVTNHALPLKLAKSNYVIALLLSLLFLQGCSIKNDFFAEPVVKVCDIPYSRYQATVTGYCQKEKAEFTNEIDLVAKRLIIRPLDDIAPFFWYTKRLNYTLAKQSTEAPLAFVIAGTGAGHNSAKNMTLVKTLYSQGYHVIALSSPTFANHIINAAGQGDMIGDLAKDAKTLHKIMQLTYQQSAEEEGISATSFSLTGYSLGGAHAAYIAKLDQQEKRFNFEKVVMVNPPVSLFNSVSILDSYLDLKNNQQAVVAMVDHIFERLAHTYANQRSSEFTEDSIYQLFNGVNLTEEELKLVIGASFRMSSSDMMYAIDNVYNIGALNYKNHHSGMFESVTHSMYRADQLTFTDYFEHAMLPWTQKIEPTINREQMIERLSLTAIEDYLRSAAHIVVTHNADDIILADGEIEFIKEVFGSRAQIFERGGHCGNMENVHFVDYIKQQFAGVTHD